MGAIEKQESEEGRSAWRLQVANQILNRLAIGIFGPPISTQGELWSECLPINPKPIRGGGTGGRDFVSRTAGKLIHKGRLRQVDHRSPDTRGEPVQQGKQAEVGTVGARKMGLRPSVTLSQREQVRCDLRVDRVGP